MAQKKRGLGRGLEALLMDNSMDQGGALTVRLSDIEPNRAQPRKEFAPEALEELADSIQQHGLLQPLLVRPIHDGGYQLVAGERRWRAAAKAGLSEVPVVIKDLTDQESMIIAMIENLQREDLTPLEEAEGYKVLVETYDLTQEDVAQKVGKSRPAVANALRLLHLPDFAMQELRAGKITPGHARSILAIQEVEGQKEALVRALKGATVRELEELAASQPDPKSRRARTPKPVKKEYVETEIALTQYLGRKVKIKEEKKAGMLMIEFYGEDDLKELTSTIAALQ